MKIIIVGCGKIGQAIIASLAAEGHDIIAVDTNPDVIASVTETYDVMGVNGNGADHDVLLECDVGHCGLFVSVTGSDELNMMSCFIAKRLGAANTVARIRKPEYNDSSLGFLKRELQLAHALNPEKLAANEIYNILRLPSAMKIETFSNGLEMVELHLRDDSVLDGVTLFQLREKYKAKVLVCCVRRGEDVFIPSGSFELKGGDLIGVTGAQAEINKLMRQLGVFQKKAKNIMILGGSRVGYYLAKKIIDGGSSVCIIDKDKKVCEDFCEQLPGARVIVADGTEHDVLIEEGLLSSDAFVALTGFDEINILTSIFASNQSVPKVVAKVNGDALKKMSSPLGLETVISPKDSVSNVISKYARAINNSTDNNNIESLYKLFDGKVEALEFSVKGNEKLIGVPLKDLKMKNNVLISAIVRNGKNIIPGGLDSIEVNDKIIVIAAESKLSCLDDVLL